MKAMLIMPAGFKEGSLFKSDKDWSGGGSGGELSSERKGGKIKVYEAGESIGKESGEGQEQGGGTIHRGGVKGEVDVTEDREGSRKRLGWRRRLEKDKVLAGIGATLKMRRQQRRRDLGGYLRV